MLTQPESHQKCFQFRTEYGRAFSFTLWKGLDEKPFWYVAILNCMHMASLDSVKSSGDMGTKVYAMHFTGLRCDPEHLLFAFFIKKYISYKLIKELNSL